MADLHVIQNRLRQMDEGRKKEFTCNMANIQDVLQIGSIKSNFFNHATHNLCLRKFQILDSQKLKGCPLDNGRHQYLPIDNFSLGSLDRLPREIIQTILLDLDLFTLTLLRSTSQSMRRVIDSLPQYLDVVKHAPNSLRGILSLELGKWISCRRLHSQLVQTDCSTCKEFGGYLYLPTCRRVCYFCYTHKDEWSPWTAAKANAYYALKPSDLAGLLTARTLPGHYGLVREKKHLSRIGLIDARAVRRAAVLLHGSEQKAASVEIRRRRDRLTDWQGRVQTWQSMPENSRPALAPAVPAYSQEIDLEDWDPQRSMCIVRFPWLNKKDGSSEYGVACTMCREKISPENNSCWRKITALYTQSQYIYHVVLCPETFRELMKFIRGKEKYQLPMEIQDSCDYACAGPPLPNHLERNRLGFTQYWWKVENYMLPHDGDINGAGCRKVCPKHKFPRVPSDVEAKFEANHLHHWTRPDDRLKEQSTLQGITIKSTHFYKDDPWRVLTGLTGMK